MANDLPLATLSVKVAKGNLYLSREICEACLPGVEAVALLDRDLQIVIVPLIPESGGGLLLKIRNRRGDRVIHAQEFFREKGYVEDFEERAYTVRWDPESAALKIADIPRVKT